VKDFRRCCSFLASLSLFRSDILRLRWVPNYPSSARKRNPQSCTSSLHDSIHSPAGLCALTSVTHVASHFRWHGFWMCYLLRCGQSKHLQQTFSSLAPTSFVPDVAKWNVVPVQHLPASYTLTSSRINAVRRSGCQSSSFRRPGLAYCVTCGLVIASTSDVLLHLLETFSAS